MRAYTVPCGSKQDAEKKAAELRNQGPNHDLEIRVVREPRSETYEVLVRRG